jgi:hypothetical protein
MKTRQTLGAGVLLGVWAAGVVLGQPAPPPLAVDARVVAGSNSNANGILEPGETVQVDPTWTNTSGEPQDVTGTAANLSGPTGPSYTMNDTSADYGTVAAGATADCNGATGDCYLISVSGARPAAHWDAVLTENLSSDADARHWTLHVGNSFADVPVGDPFYPFIETIFHNGVTAGCNAPGDPPAYCMNAAVTRAQIAVFLLKGKLGAGHVSPPATGTVFGDVHVGDFAADWIEELAGLGITNGCGNGNYCPNDSLTRAQMAVLLLRSEHGAAYAPPACRGLFADVPCPSTLDFPYSDWIEQLSNEAITAGCSPAPPGGLPGYCPDEPVTRAEMAVFLVKTFGLLLYGPPRAPQVFTASWAGTRACPYPSGELNYGFAPGTIHVYVGDTVNWVWSDEVSHSTTSATWDSGVQTAPYSFSQTFTQPGTIPFHCSQGHQHWYQSCRPFQQCQCIHSIFPVHETGTVVVDP